MSFLPNQLVSGQSGFVFAFVFVFYHDNRNQTRTLPLSSWGNQRGSGITSKNCAGPACPRPTEACTHACMHAHTHTHTHAYTQMPMATRSVSEPSVVGPCLRNRKSPETLGHLPEEVLHTWGSWRLQASLPFPQVFSELVWLLSSSSWQSRTYKAVAMI